MFFPRVHRDQSGVEAGDEIVVQLELEIGRREVVLPEELQAALVEGGIFETFNGLNDPKRKEYARQVLEAKGLETNQRRIQKVISDLSSH